ncbi:hypothetical protein QKW52_16305 [Bacillus sonorensis]|nr:hypothetical protein [Bacillus sonorensis]
MTNKKLWAHVAELAKDIADYYMGQGDEKKALIILKNHDMPRIKYAR